MTSGHGGCMSTLHATYPPTRSRRLETMAMMSDVEMPLAALRIQLASAVNIIVQVSRLQDGSRKITHVTEVCGFDAAAGEYVDAATSSSSSTGSRGRTVRSTPRCARPGCCRDRSG